MKIAAEFIEKHGGIIDKAKRERQNGQAMFVLPASVMQKKTNEMKKETNVMFMAPDDLHDAKIAAFCTQNNNFGFTQSRRVIDSHVPLVCCLAGIPDYHKLPINI